MAEPLKNYFTSDVVHRIASSLVGVYPSFDVEAFTAMALDGFEEHELMARCRHIAQAMARFLPEDRGRAIGIVVDSFGPELENCDPDDATPAATSGDGANPMTGFFYMPHGIFVADEGVGHFDEAMRANYELTKRFTAEFSVRSQLDVNTEAALTLMAAWAVDDNVHVRRCVSEGTRPRLPWATRLKKFQEDPSPVVALLEMLKDDPVEYVRRSVANNLNDIAKDHPEIVVEVAKRWWKDGDHNRRRLVRHALRTLIKAGDPGALDVLGYGPDSPAAVGQVSIEPARVAIGDKVRIEATIENPSSEVCGALVDLRIHFVKANGTTSVKVFKGAEVTIDAGGSAVIAKTISVAQHTTRKHYPGSHCVEVMINGRAHPAGTFDLLP